MTALAMILIGVGVLGGALLLDVDLDDLAKNLLGFGNNDDTTDTAEQTNTDTQQSTDTEDSDAATPPVLGTDVANFVTGSVADDAIDASGGNDTVSGGAGADTIDGGLGNDSIDAGAGDDAVMGGLGDDYAFGASGSDTLTGDSGDDIVIGGRDADVLSGGAGNDLLDGSAGLGRELTAEEFGEFWTNSSLPDDVSEVFDDQASDTLDGGLGDDRLVLSNGDIGTGAEGRDTFVIQDDNLQADGALTLEGATIADFNPETDQIAVTRLAGTQAPNLSLGSDENGDAQIFADGQLIATLTGVPESDVDLSNITQDSFEPLQGQNFNTETSQGSDLDEGNTL